jgi:ABC-type polysaccharide/polyol phosphate export permease
MNIAQALSDVTTTFKRFPIFGALAWLDLQERYHRSVLGPLWMAMSLAIISGSFGFLYARILNIDHSTFIPFITCALFGWLYFQNTITESTNTFIASAGMIKNAPQPLFGYVARVILRNLLVAAHTLPVALAVLLFYGKILDVNPISLFLGTILLIFNLVWMATLMGLLGARYRDVPYIVSYILQFLMFVSPIFWMPNMLRGREWYAEINPLYHWLSLVRDPLLGIPIPLSSWVFSISSLAIGGVFTFFMFAKYRRRIAFWV